jgi:hypothetical protein
MKGTVQRTGQPRIHADFWWENQQEYSLGIPVHRREKNSEKNFWQRVAVEWAKLSQNKTRRVFANGTSPAEVSWPAA